MPDSPDSRDEHLSALHEERERLRAERLHLTRRFGSMLAERRAMIDELRATAEASRRRTQERAKGD